MQEILTERPNLFEPNITIAFYIKLNKEIDSAALKTAIQTAYAANELSSSRIILKPDGRAYYEKMASSGCKIIITEKEWQKVLQENEKIPFSLENGELIRTFILSSGNHTSLLIMAHHLVGDGKSIVYLTEDIMNALHGTKLTYKPSALLNRNSLMQGKKLPVFVAAYAAISNLCWKMSRHPAFTWRDYYKLHNHYWKNHSAYIRYHTFSKHDTYCIIQNAKQMGISVNSYIITAFLQGYGHHCIVGIPVSVRKNDCHTMSNLTSGISISHTFAKSKSFSQNAICVHKKIYDALGKQKWFVLKFISALSPTLIDAVLLHTHGLYDSHSAKKLANTMGYVGSKTRNLGITNLSQLDIPVVYGSYQIEDFVFIPPVISYTHNIIGVITSNDKMTLSYHGISDGQNDTADTIFDRGIKYLLLH